VLRTHEPLITNDPSHHPSSHGVPPGHPPLLSFCGLPLRFGSRIVGMLGIANRPGGYDESVVRFLEPLLQTCANIIESSRNERRRIAVEHQIQVN
jgi:GAF domain-containing protein